MTKIFRPDGLNPWGVPTTHYLSVIAPWNPKGYDPEFQRDMAEKLCDICKRLWGEHDRDEFSDHWEQLFNRTREKQ